MEWICLQPHWCITSGVLSVFPLIPAALSASLASPLVRISPWRHGDGQSWVPGSVLVVCAINLCHLEVQLNRVNNCLTVLGKTWKWIDTSWIFSISNIRFLASSSLLWISRSASCMQTDILRLCLLQWHQGSWSVPVSPLTAREAALLLDSNLTILPVSLILCKSALDCFCLHFWILALLNALWLPRVSPFLWTYFNHLLLYISFFSLLTIPLA